MSKKARSLWFAAPRKVEIREEDIQKKPGEIMVESRLMGISHGTELLFFRNELPVGLESDLCLKSLEGTLSYPIKYGYINIGITESGKKVFAFYPHQDLFAVTENELLELPEELSLYDAIFTAHMETAVSIVQDARPVFGDVVLIYGQGTIGLLVTEIITQSKLSEVITVDPLPMRRELSARLGCVSLNAEDVHLREKILSLTDQRGADCVINTSGSEKALQSAIETACFEGTIVEASWYGSKRVNLQLGSFFHRKRLRLRSSQVSTLNPDLTGRWDKNRRFGLVFRLLEKIKPSKYITQSYKLKDAQMCFEHIDNNPFDTIQVILEP
jgi:threonine dehydrogenase-like Zn-dependent dehydrogenase